MANDSCVRLDDNEVKDLVEKCVDELGNELNELLVGMRTESGRPIIGGSERTRLTYFKEVIKRYKTDKDNNVEMSKTVGQMQKLLKRYKEEKDKEDELYTTGKWGRITIGEDSVDLNSISGILNDAVEITAQGDLVGSVRGTIVNLIKEQLNSALGQESWKDEKFSKIIDEFARGDYNISVGDLTALVSLVAAGTNKEGKPFVSLSSVKDALKGKSSVLDRIRRDYRVMADERDKIERNPSTFETKVMRTVLRAYMAKHPETLMALKETGTAPIKAASGSTRQYRMLSKELRLIRDKSEPVNVNTAKFSSLSPLQNLPFIPSDAFWHKVARAFNAAETARGRKATQNLAETLIQGFNEWSQGKADFEGVYSPTAVLAFLNDYFNGHGLNFDTLDNPGDVQAEIQKDAGGEYTEGLTRDAARQILEAGFQEGMSLRRASMSQSVVRKTMIESGINELTYDESRGIRFMDEFMDVLTKYRDRVLAQAAEEAEDFNVYDEEDDEADVNARLKKLTTRICEANFDTNKLEEHTNAIAHKILEIAETSRYSYISENEKDIEVKESFKASVERRKEELLSKGSLTEEEEGMLDTMDGLIKQTEADINRLKRLNKELHDDYLWRKAAVRYALKPVIDDEGNVVDKGLLDKAVDRAKKVGKKRKIHERVITGQKVDKDGNKHPVYGFKEREETDEEYQERKFEAAKMDHMRDQLLCRALCKLESMTGIHIILNPSTNEYEVEGEARADAELNGSTGFDGDEGAGEAMDKGEMDFNQEYDPYAHLSTSLRSLFSMIPQIDENTNQPKLDSMGRQMYYDPELIYKTLLAIHNKKALTARDVCWYKHDTAETPLDDTNAVYPPLINERGLSEGGKRTEKQAFPNGKPVFPILEQNRGRYPWVDQLIRILEETAMERSTIAEENTVMRLSTVVTDFCVQCSSFEFQNRMMFRTKPGMHSNNLFVTNKIAEVEGIRIMQRSNYRNRIALNDLCIYDADGSIIYANLKQLRDMLSELGPITSVAYEDDDVAWDYADTISRVLEALGIAVDKNRIFSELRTTGNVQGWSRMGKLFESTYNLLEWMRREFQQGDQEQAAYSDHSHPLYANLGGMWNHLFETVGFYVNASFFPTSTTENKVTRQNMIAKNTRQRILDIVTYNAREMLFATPEERKKLLKERQQRIDNAFKASHWDPMLQAYRNPILNALYNGEDVDKDFSGSSTDLLNMGDSIALSAFDDIDLRDFSPSQMLAIELAGFMRSEERATTEGHALYAEATYADAPVMVMTTDKVRSEQECVDIMSDYVFSEWERMENRDAHKADYARIWALHHHQANKTRYKDPVLDDWVDRNPDDDWKWERDWLIRDYLEAQKNGTVRREGKNYTADELYEELQKLSGKSKSAFPTDQWDVEQAIQYYKEVSEFVPWESYFKGETKFNWLPELNIMALPTVEVVGRILDKYEAREDMDADAVEAIRSQFQRYIFGLEGRSFTLKGLLAEIMPAVIQDMNAANIGADALYDLRSDVVRDIIDVYTAETMEREYRRYLRDRDFPVVEDEYKHRELGHLNQLEAALTNSPDYNGDVWINNLEEVQDVQDGRQVTKYRLRSTKDKYTYITLTDKEAEYYYKRKSGEIPDNGVFPGENAVYRVSTIRTFKPWFASQKELLDIIQLVRKGQPKREERVEPDVELMQYVRSMAYNTLVHNTAMDDMMGMDPAFFKDSDDAVKRRKGLYSNGTGCFKERPTALQVERVIIVADDETAVSEDLPNLLETAYKDMSLRSHPERAIDRVLAHAAINGTNAQGWTTIEGHRAKLSSGGSSIYGMDKEEDYQNRENGNYVPENTDEYNPAGVAEASKPVTMCYIERRDPWGNLARLPFYVKNSETPMMYQYPDMPSSPSGKAINEFCREVEYADGIKIHSVQRPTGVKTPKSGIIAQHYVPRRIEGLKDLLAGRMSVEEFIQEFEGQMDSKLELTPATVEKFINFLSSMCTAYGISHEYLTFETIDNFIHKGLKPRWGKTGYADATKRGYRGIEEIVEGCIKREKGFGLETSKKMLQDLINLRRFMMPINDDPVTIQGLKDVLQEKAVSQRTNSEGKTELVPNESYVYEIDPDYTSFQVRQSNHLYESEVHVGSQASFLLPSGINPTAMYDVEINGEKAQVSGYDLYEKFHQCLAARLVSAYRELEELFGDDKKALRALQRRITNIAQNNDKYGPDVVEAVNIVKRMFNGEEVEMFSTPIGSVAVLYKISDLLTSFVRSATHKRKINGGTAVIEADVVYADNLGIVRDEDNGNKIVGVECLLPAWCREILEGCLTEKKIKVDGKEQTVRMLDPSKLTDEAKRLIGYRIPTEDYHSMLPLIVKDFLPQSKGGMIVVAKEITSLTGGDNDIDKLFLMLKNLDRNMKAYRYKWDITKSYDWNKPLARQDEKAIENMFMDISMALLTAKENESRFIMPQNPDTFKGYGQTISYLLLPEELRMRKNLSTNRWVYEPDNPDWNDKTKFSRDIDSWRELSADDIKNHLKKVKAVPPQSLRGITRYKNQYALADSGVAIGANRLAVYTKARIGLNLVATNAKDGMHIKGDKTAKRGLEYVSRTRSGEIKYCAEMDDMGIPVADNMSDFIAAMVDSAKSSWAIDIGLNSNNADFAAYLLMCGLSKQSMCFIMGILKDNPNFIKDFGFKRRELVGEGKQYPDEYSYGTIDLDKLPDALLRGKNFTKALLNIETLRDNEDLFQLCNVIYNLHRNYKGMRKWEGTTNFNSAKHGLSNEPASALWAILQVVNVSRNKKKLPSDVPEELFLVPGLSYEQILNGETDNGKIGLWLSQMYYTLGIEVFTKVMGKKMFYANPAFLKLILNPSISKIMDKLSKEDAIKFIKQLHDEFTAYHLSDMNMFKQTVNEDGEVVPVSFQEMRDRYRYKYPNDVRSGRAFNMKELGKKYAVIRALEEDNGKLIISREKIKSESSIREIKSSLVRMANSPDPAEKKIALDLFMYSYFADGLRFGYGSISQFFTSAFLASEVFEEYNIRIQNMCTEDIPNDKLRNFAEQFVRSNYKRYEIGLLFRCVPNKLSATQKKDDEETPMSEQALAEGLETDELTSYDVARLEDWLARPESGGRILLNGKNLENEHGRVLVEYPYKLASKLSSLPSGTLIRVQASHQVYHQNLYMLTTHEGQPCLVKLADMTSDKWYNENMTILEMAALDCTGDPRKRKVGSWSRILRGTRAYDEEEQRIRFLNHLPERRKYVSQNDEEGTDFDNPFDDEYDPYGEDPFSEDEYNAFDEDPMSDDADGFDDEDGEDDTKLRRPYRPGDKTRPMNMNDFGELLKEDEEDEVEIRYMMDTGSGPSVEERKQQVREQFGVTGPLSDKRSAMEKAYRINTAEEPTGFVATIQKRDDKYHIILSDVTDASAQARWRNQYGVAVMTGDQGINSVMNGIGNTDISFVEDDGIRKIDDYNTEVDELIKFIGSCNSPGISGAVTISRTTAADIIKKFYGFNTAMTSLAEDLWTIMKNGAVNEDTGEVVSGEDFMRQWMTRDQFDALKNDVINSVEPVLEAVQAVMAGMLINIKDTVDGCLDTPAEWYAKQFLTKCFGTLRREMGPLASQTDRLNEIKDNASAEERSRRTEEQRTRAHRQAQEVQRGVNHVERLRRIMEQALFSEERKRKMTVEQRINPAGSGIDERIGNLDWLLSDDGEPLDIPGVVNYLSAVADEYRLHSPFLESLGDGSCTLSHQDRLNRLARILTILRSHEEMLEQLHDLMLSPDFAEKKRKYDISDDVSASLEEMVTVVERLHKEMSDIFSEHAGEEFIAFVKEFTGELPQLRNEHGETMTWEQLMQIKDGDISWIDMALRSMGETDDPVGQIYDRIVKLAKDRARTATIKDVQGEIREFNDFIQANHLNDFEFMFEHDENGKKTGYYLTRYKMGAFHKEREQEKAKLDKAEEDYRKGRITKAEYDAAAYAYSAWVERNADPDPISPRSLQPKDIEKWRNPEWAEFQRGDAAKKECLEKFKKIKNRLDTLLGNQTNHARAIQRRMTSEQRFRANFTLSPSALFENIKEQLAADYLVREDDYNEAGERSGTLDFNGNERLVIPAPYVRMLHNPNELSTDPVGCLVAYAYAANNYNEMREIANPLEVGFEAIIRTKVQHESRAGRDVVETYGTGRKAKAVVKDSRFLRKLRSFLDSQIYMKYIQDKDDTFKLWGKEFRKSKIINAFLHMSAVAQLGFNWLVDLASLANGVAQTNIEAAARRHFSGTALRNADIAYWKELPKFVADLTNPIKTNKLFLISERLNIMQNFDVKVYNNRRNGLISKLFNAQIAFMGTSCGNHWLYHRVAIAKMMSTKVKVPRKVGDTIEMVETNLWDAFELVDTEHGGKYAQIVPGTVLEDGTRIDDEWLSAFGREIDHINHQLIGIYNRDDMNMAQKISWAKLLQAYRKHIVPLMDRRFRAKHKNEFGQDEEGFYRTTYRFVADIYAAQFRVMAVWNDLPEEDKQNVRAAMVDILQWLGLLMIGALVFGGGDDDDDEDTLEKVCKYLVARETHELGSMINPVTAAKEIVNMSDQPFMGTSQLADIANFANTVCSFDWFSRVQAGPFKGQTEIEMRTRKLPIPVLSYYRNIDKFFNGVDNSTWFYNRGYVGNGGKV